MTAVVMYATREGQAMGIAEHVAESMSRRGIPADPIDAAHIPPGFSLGAYSAALLIASVHRGRHEREMTAFVKLHVAELERIPAAFLSVSLSEAGAEDAHAPADRRKQATADATGMMEKFLAETGWHPARIISRLQPAVAGALAYTKYNFALRLVMRHIARQAGQATNTSKDREYTDWAALDDFVEDFIRQPPAGALTKKSCD